MVTLRCTLFVAMVTNGCVNVGLAEISNLFVKYLCVVLYLQFVCVYSKVLDRDTQMDNPCSWLSDAAWDNVTELDKSDSCY